MSALAEIELEHDEQARVRESTRPDEPRWVTVTYAFAAWFWVGGLAGAACSTIVPVLIWPSLGVFFLGGVLWIVVELVRRARRSHPGGPTTL